SHHIKIKEDEPELSPETVQSHCQQLYKLVEEYPDPDEPEYILSTLFLQLPSKRQYPDYYEVIKNPIALSNIKTKIDQKEYKSVSELKADIDLMVSNAKRYNIKESQVYQDAVKIHKLVKRWRPDDDKNNISTTSRRSSLKDKTSSSSPSSASGSSTSPSTTNGTKIKTVLKLPGGAFGNRQQQQPPPPQQQHVKAIRLKAVDKQSKKRTVTLQELMESIGRSDQNKTLELLEADPTINVNELLEVEMFGDKFKWGPLHAACFYGDVKICQALINRGANIELNDTWYSATPLGWAAFGDRDEVARFLVEKYNANRKAKNIHDQVPFDVVNDKNDPRWIGIFKGPFNQPQPQQPQPQQPQPTLQQQEPQPQQQEQPEKKSSEEKSQSPATVTSTTESPQPTTSGKKRRGRPPKSEIEEIRPVEEIDLHDFNPVEFMKDIFHACRVHTDNSGRLYSEIFEDLPDRKEYPDYYNVITDPRSLSMMENNMIHRRYPTLGAWWDDLKLVFENAMEYNEPGSRVFRDAKLLLRLINRLKDKTFARSGIPEKQEPAVMRLIVSNVPYEVDDRRRPPYKRPGSKPRSQTEERNTVTPTPEIHHLNHHPSQPPPPPMNMLIQPPLPPSSQLPLQQPIPQHIVVQQQTQSIPQHQPTPGMMNTPAGRSIIRPFMNGQPSSTPGMMNILGAISTNSAHPAFPTPDFVPLHPPPSSSSLHEMVSNGVSNEPTTMMMMNGQQPPLQMNEDPSNLSTSSTFFDMFNVDMRDLRPLKAIQLESSDKTLNTLLDGHVIGHSLTVSSKVDTITIKPILEQALLPEQQRISIAVLQNNNRLNMSGMEPSWQSAPLLRGLNTIKITVTANLTRAPNMMPDYRTQIYFLFITQTW
ncbi:hypothetical protein INT45_005820, partial [Circinella minor]